MSGSSLLSTVSRCPATMEYHRQSYISLERFRPSGATGLRRQARWRSIIPNLATPRAGGADSQVMAAARGQSASTDDVSPFFEPLCRTFLLGISFGVCLETAHMLLTLASFANLSGVGNVWNAMASHAEATPLFLQDHIVALTAWMLLYAIESAGVSLRHRTKNLPSDLEMNLVNLPQKMLPLKLTLFRTLWLKSPYFRRQSAALTATPPPSALPAIAAPVKERTAPSAPVAPVVSTPRVRAPAPTDAILQAPPKREGLKPGEWDPAQGDVARREIDRINRQSYLQNFWYCIASNVDEAIPAGQLREIRVMGKSLALWRESDCGKVNAISNFCTHRGAPLHKGWLDHVEGKECVRCPYHAWAFSGEGTVQDIPVQPDKRFPKRALQENFETKIVDGNLWLFWGNRRIPDEERCPPPGAAVAQPEKNEENTRIQYRAAEHLQPHWLTYERLVSEDRILAIATAFLGSADAKITRTNGGVSADAFSTSTTFSLQVRSRRFNLLYNGALPDSIPVSVTLHLPSSVTIEFDIGSGSKLTVASHVRPTTYDTCTVHTTVTRNFALWPGSNAVAQDVLNTWVEGERSRNEGNAAPKSWRMPAGTLHRAFTTLRQEYIAMGYGVPPELALQHHRSDM